MYPILWSKGITIYSFGTLIVIGFLVAALYARRRAARTLGLDRERVFNVCFALLFLGLAGARLLYGLVHYDAFTGKPLEIFALWKGGLLWYGGLIGALLWLAWYLPRHPDMKGWALLDVLALGTCLGIFVGRWASFLSGEDYGKPAPDGLPWKVMFTSPDGMAPRNVWLHPAQLYHSVHGLVLFGILLLLARRKPYAGRIAGAFLVLYALGHAVIEIWRGDDEARGMLIDGMVSTSQFLSVPVLFAGVAIWLLRRPPADAKYA
jgi:phosphatidylglycerol---prolipoprotein diacylglyceryl transferase